MVMAQLSAKPIRRMNNFSQFGSVAVIEQAGRIRLLRSEDRPPQLRHVRFHGSHEFRAERRPLSGGKPTHLRVLDFVSVSEALVELFEVLAEDLVLRFANLFRRHRDVE